MKVLFIFCFLSCVCYSNLLDEFIRASAKFSTLKQLNPFGISHEVIKVPANKISIAKYNKNEIIQSKLLNNLWQIHFLSLNESLYLSNFIYPCLYYKDVFFTDEKYLDNLLKKLKPHTHVGLIPDNVMFDFFVNYELSSYYAGLNQNEFLKKAFTNNTFEVSEVSKELKKYEPFL